MSPGFGPRAFTQSPGSATVSGAEDDNAVEGASVLVGIPQASQRSEVGFFTRALWKSDFSSGLHSWLSWGSPLGSEVVVCVDTSLASWQFRQTLWPLLRFLEHSHKLLCSSDSWVLCAHISRALQFSCETAPLMGSDEPVLRSSWAVWSRAAELAACLQWSSSPSSSSSSSLSSVQVLGQEMKDLLSMDFFHPKSRLEYLQKTRHVQKFTETWILSNFHSTYLFIPPLARCLDSSPVWNHSSIKLRIKTNRNHILKIRKALNEEVKRTEKLTRWTCFIILRTWTLQLYLMLVFYHNEWCTNNVLFSF